MSADRYTRLLRRRLQHRETLRNFFERYDLLLTPTTPCVAWDIERPLPPPPAMRTRSYGRILHIASDLTGQPAGSLPCGMSAEALPIGLQFVVPLCHENRLIAAMTAAESALDGNRPLPVIDLGRESLVK